MSSSGRESTGSPAPKPQDRSFPFVIPEIDIWRAAALMLKRYGDKALEESPTWHTQKPSAATSETASSGRRDDLKSII